MKESFRNYHLISQQRDFDIWGNAITDSNAFNFSFSWWNWIISSMSIIPIFSWPLYSLYIVKFGINFNPFQFLAFFVADIWLHYWKYMRYSLQIHGCSPDTWII